MMGGAVRCRRWSPFPPPLSPPPLSLWSKPNGQGAGGITEPAKGFLVKSPGDPLRTPAVASDWSTSGQMERRRVAYGEQWPYNHVQAYWVTVLVVFWSTMTKVCFLRKFKYRQCILLMRKYHGHRPSKQQRPSIQMVDSIYRTHTIAWLPAKVQTSTLCVSNNLLRIH